MLRAFQMPLVSKGAKIRNLYNQVPHLTQDTQYLKINKSNLAVILHKREYIIYIKTGI